ncbi:unnamed protein product [Linum tenue]|uniref:Endoglucanase n=1 Tax=Linum tenue TaxID=586396 RepID=A0AAV0H288_9ROSI|nr:unnamed protein product [Linum tenue]
MKKDVNHYCNHHQHRSILSFILIQITIIAAVAAPFSDQSSSVPDYGDALSKSLLYFESQRSGRLPHGQRVNWRHHSALLDGLEQGVDLVGGYYDAGDNVKFGLPMAFTITMLSWGVIEYGDDMAAAGEYHHALEAIKWGTDYFVKAHTSPNVLWVQVGDGDTDHYCWQRPEDMATSRRAYKVDEKNPGSEVAGETAAAGFYPSTSGYNDELLWAALWLYKATTNQTYLNYALQNAHHFGGATWAVKEFSWDIKYAGLQLLASTVRYIFPIFFFQTYRSKAEYYLCANLNKNVGNDNVQLTPGGLIYIRQWNNLQYASSAAFLLTVYSDHLRSTNRRLSCSAGGHVDPSEILGFVRSQVDYVLGKNPAGTSYLVGYGKRYPQRVHHRGASTASYKSHEGFIGCVQGYDIWYRKRDPNPNVLVGAVVGGPDEKDRFRDVRENHMQTEACTYNTAALVGVFARLNRLEEEEDDPFDEYSSSTIASM